ncbi:MAG: hypothetical protein VX672_05175 [Planctomycetota bacterium]|nr:hypothetical protein [Planctomycetota bacterium]
MSHLAPDHGGRGLRRIGRRAGWLVVAGMVSVGGAGCQDVLFDKNDPRTQFETHDRLRQRYVPLEEKNVFGETQPALRARLSPQT